MSEAEQYAIIKSGGFQYRVTPGMKLQVPTLEGEEGNDVVIEEVLLVGGSETKIGTPLVSGAKVKAKLLGHGRGKKLIVFKKKRRKGYKLKKGHRQGYSEILIESIEG